MSTPQAFGRTVLDGFASYAFLVGSAAGLALLVLGLRTRRRKGASSSA